jgi:hypothetical protein
MRNRNVLGYLCALVVGLRPDLQEACINFLPVQCLIREQNEKSQLKKISDRGVMRDRRKAHEDSDTSQHVKGGRDERGLH